MRTTDARYGYALYTTTVPPWLAPTITLGGMRDLAHVYLGRALRQTCGRGTEVDSVVCQPANGTSPPRACPSGWTPHDGGFWANLDPCNECPHDHANATVDLCAAKCNHTVGCEAFEVYNGPDDAASCFIFVGGLKPPFISNPDCFTCVKPSKKFTAAPQQGDGATLPLYKREHSPVSTTSDRVTSRVHGGSGGGDDGVQLDILVENFGRVTGGLVGTELSFRGISRSGSTHPTDPTS
jgi:hypothetical protein